MSVTFTKLFSSITESTMWICEDAETRVVWITMLAMSDRMGRVWGSIPGLAHRARVSIEKTEESLNKFLAPDQYSRTKEFEGRRIEVIDGGWRLLNHDKYRKLRDEDERREYKKHWIANKRSEVVDNVDKSRPQYTQAEAYTDTDTDTVPVVISIPPVIVVDNANALSAPTSASKAEKQNVPFSKIVSLYHELLPELPKVAKLTKQRMGYIRQRWLEDLSNLGEWRKYFEIVRKSKFLMGLSPGSSGRPPFRADLNWLCRPENIVKVIEGKYHRG